MRAMLRLAVLAVVPPVLYLTSTTPPPLSASHLSGEGRRLESDQPLVRSEAAHPALARRAASTTSDRASRLACPAPYTDIIPCTGNAQKYTSDTTNTQTFNVASKNPIEPVSYGYSCSGTGVVVSCSVPKGLPAVPANGSQRVTVTYVTGPTPGTGTLTFIADDGTQPATATVTVTTTVKPPPPPARRVQVSSAYWHYDLDPQAAWTGGFTVTNAGTDTSSFSYTLTCTGSALAGPCSSTGGTTATLQPGGSQSFTYFYNTSATVGGTGQIKVVASRVNAGVIDPAVSDSGLGEITVVRGSVGVDIASVNPGSDLERGLCLNLSAGEDAAAECGDLRLVHPLPAVRTRNKARAPALIYNSQFAHPAPVIAANVTLSDTATVPDTVLATLLRGGVARSTGKWAGSDFARGATRRIALVDSTALGVNTGNYTYTLNVTYKYNSSGQSVTQASASKAIAVVNRSASPFGPGWWLAGLEQLVRVTDTTRRLWVAGDGSTRLYTKAAPSAAVWTAFTFDRPDTLKWDQASQRYTRYAEHGLKVVFDALGRHVATVNRLGDTTSFGYASPTSTLLTTITVPPAGAGKTYTLQYDSSQSYGIRLRTVTAPPAPSGPRTTALTPNASGQLAAIRDPDGTAVSFGYDAAFANRITSRTDRRQTTTSYAYDAANLLAQVSLAMDSGKTIITKLEAQASVGLAGKRAAQLVRVYTTLNGPRTDTTWTGFWLDRFGMPAQIMDAAGSVTVLTRGKPGFPALVTRLRYPNGRVLGATYDSRGNITALTDSSTYDAARGKYATTSYTWDGTYDFVTMIAMPEGETTRFGYNAANGNRLWQEDGAGLASRINFEYYNPSDGFVNGLLRAVRMPSGARDSVTYDRQLANLATTVTPLGYATVYATDNLGRVVTVTSQYDDNPQHTVVERHHFDLADQDTLTVTTGVTATGGTETRSVRLHYDANGNLDTLQKWASPDRNNIGVVTQAFVYDRANRKVQESLVGAPGALPIAWSYDAAGNLLDGGRRPTVNTYDKLNRVIRKIGSDTANFGYDAAGNLLYANNSAARIARSYNLNGTLRADTLQIATATLADRDFSKHVYAISSAYDLNGRRVSVNGRSYAFDSQTGLLASVTDGVGNRFTFRYDYDRRLTGRTLLAQRADSITETDSYDLDSRLVRRVQRSGATILHDDSLVYRRDGKVLSNPLTADSLAYSPFGMLTYSRYPALRSSGYETFSYDALGNKVSGTTWGPGYANNLYSYKRNSDRLDKALHPGTPTDTTFYGINARGEMSDEETRHHFSGPTGPATETRRTINNYSRNRMLIENRFTFDTALSATTSTRPYIRVETYRYDALGRRVWQRVERDTTACKTHEPTSGCRSELTRTVWDGNQILFEIRAPGDPTSTALENDNYPGVFYGVVGYTHGLGVDAPLALVKNGSTVVPLADWAGRFDMGWCPSFSRPCTGIDFSMGSATAYGDTPPYPTGPRSWYGSLITGQTDGSGYQYRRNRYYDPTTGRFTQEDPIGLAGGLNAYGYAEGDPISYSDPFGLCSWGKLDDCEYFSVRFTAGDLGVKFDRAWGKFRATVTPLGKGEISVKVSQSGVRLGGNLKTGASAELSASAGPASVSVNGSCTLTMNNTGGCKGSTSATLKADTRAASVDSGGNASFSFPYGVGRVEVSGNIHDSFIGATNWMFEAYRSFEQYTRDVSGVPR